jgi:DNA replication protein DnaC
MNENLQPFEPNTLTSPSILKTTFPQDLLERIDGILERNPGLINYCGCPVNEERINSPEECPWGNDDNCQRCDDPKNRPSMRIPLPEPNIVIFNTGSCRKSHKAKNLSSESGLTASEMKHLFLTATKDSQNSKTITAMQKYDFSKGRGAYLTGGNGTGKTYLLHCLVNKLCADGTSCVFTSVYNLLGELRATIEEKALRSEDDILYRYTRPKVLLLDDIGKEQIRTDWAPERIFRLVDTRFREGKPIIYSSNCNAEELEARLGENFGSAIMSRIMGNVDVWKIGGNDRRLQH